VRDADGRDGDDSSRGWSS